MFRSGNFLQRKNASSKFLFCSCGSSHRIFYFKFQPKEEAIRWLNLLPFIIFLCNTKMNQKHFKWIRLSLFVPQGLSFMCAFQQWVSEQPSNGPMVEDFLKECETLLWEWGKESIWFLGATSFISFKVGETRKWERDGEERKLWLWNCQSCGR